ncbi:MAG: hypothetical protein FJ279_23395 [Planctomycetes bacterium]|nr:hypothetical protein [Planctomycetota bacterium]MBM4084866.1 hypothetical protein [Planctomycetota bacterium]
MKTPEIALAVGPVVQAFEELGVAYSLCGSLASCAYGIARSTLDADLVADMRAEHARGLVQMLKAAYYVDEAMILDAIRRQSHFNLIHLETMIKVDVFLLKDTPYDREAFGRRRRDTLADAHGSLGVYVHAPEDVALHKLGWFRAGGRVSQRQWDDVLGVLRVQAGRLDMEYLQRWAGQLGLRELLQQALREAALIQRPHA